MIIITRLLIIPVFLRILAASYTTGMGVAELLITGNHNNPCTPEAASLLSSIINTSDPFGSVDLLISCYCDKHNNNNQWYAIESYMGYVVD